jgi:tRNA (uracil-5-)-methyltransferase
LPLARYFDKVLATEISKRSIRAALENCELNDVRNVTFVRMASEEMTQALRKEREFRRMEGVRLEAFDFTVALVDPPRAGLDEGTARLISDMRKIVYISCNPETLARDLKRLTRTHRIERAAMFDQFPHTEHIESGVVLVKR